MSIANKPGRRPTFSPALRAEFAAMTRKFGARGTCERSPIRISLGTVLKIAREFQIPMKKGRRLRSEADSAAGPFDLTGTTHGRGIALTF